ncbi:hypothetical protein P3S67_022651 [Capsicum chacoense]
MVSYKELGDSFPYKEIASYKETFESSLDSIYAFFISFLLCSFISFILFSFLSLFDPLLIFFFISWLQSSLFAIDFLVYSRHLLWNLVNNFQGPGSQDTTYKRQQVVNQVHICQSSKLQTCSLTFHIE